MADLQEAMTAGCETMLTFLEESNVPDAELAPLRELAASGATPDAEELLDIAWEIGQCIAHMRHDIVVGENFLPAEGAVLPAREEPTGVVRRRQRSEQLRVRVGFLSLVEARPRSRV